MKSPLESMPSPDAFILIVPPFIVMQLSPAEKLSFPNIPANPDESSPAAFMPSSEAVSVTSPPFITTSLPSSPS